MKIISRAIFFGVCFLFIVAANLFYHPWKDYWHGQWDHVVLNFCMCDAQTVRADCLELLSRHRPAENHRALIPKGDLPPSFIRLGAQAAQVTADSVLISLETTPFDGAWGYLYDPNASYKKRGWISGVRSTWHRDFYEFRIYGE